jgi:hypothetical protein
VGYFILEAALFLPGLIAFILGKIPLTRRRAVSGSAARIVGAILMIPLPLYLVACKQSHVPPLGSVQPGFDPFETQGFARLSALLAAFGSILAAGVLTIIASETRRR